jgi:hypothetical protein
MNRLVNGAYGFGVCRQSAAATALWIFNLDFDPKRCRAAITTALQIN